MANVQSRLACALGFHTWSDWVYLRQRECAQWRGCRECGRDEIQVTHVWQGPKYVFDADYCQNRICRRCRAVEPIVATHQWEEWRYDSPASCHVSRACSRCNQLEEQIRHSWCGSAHYQPEASTESQVCVRCGQSMLMLSTNK
jgi:ribosomal protein L40E